MLFHVCLQLSLVGSSISWPQNYILNPLLLQLIKGVSCMGNPHVVHNNYWSLQLTMFVLNPLLSLLIPHDSRDFFHHGSQHLDQTTFFLVGMDCKQWSFSPLNTPLQLHTTQSLWGWKSPTTSFAPCVFAYMIGFVLTLSWAICIHATCVFPYNPRLPSLGPSWPDLTKYELIMQWARFMCLGVYLVLSLDILGFPCTTHHSIPLQLLCLHCILILSLSSHAIDTSYLPTISLCNHHIHTHVTQKQAPSCFITQPKKLI